MDLIMKYLPLILVLGIIAYVIWLNYRNQNGRAPKWYTVNLPGNRKAVTMPPFGIYIEPDAKNVAEITRHEQCHWQQYQQKGLVKFYSDYFKLKKLHPYEQNPMEVECFNAQ